MVGTCKSVSTDAPQRFDQENARRGVESRWVGQDAGDVAFTFSPNGRFRQVQKRESKSDFAHRVDGVAMDQTVTIEMVADGRWSAPSEGRLEICKDSIKGTMTNTIVVGGLRQTSPPQALPHDAAAEQGGFDYTVSCGAERARIALLLDGSEFISWQAQRVGGVP